MDKLKPCPFCGSDETQTHCKKRIGKPVEINGMRYWHAECLDCGSRTRNCFDDDADLCACKDGKETAIKAWNKRTPERTTKAQADAECTCDGELGNNDIYCPVHCQPCYS